MDKNNETIKNLENTLSKPNLDASIKRGLKKRLDVIKGNKTINK